MVLDSDHGELLQRIQDFWPAARVQQLRFLGAKVQALGSRLYLVGGVVRDLFLARPSQDWDLAIDGPLEPFLDVLQDLGFRLDKRSRFDTATLVGPEGLRWDLARCRGERYPQPAALPEVFPADIHTDLQRRDFRCNAIALQLTPDAFAEVLDPFCGREDLRAGILEVLHPRSFQDDPTRILRGLRFAKRFGFSLGPQSRQQLREVLETHVFVHLGGARLFRELSLLLQLPGLPGNLQTLRDWGLGPLLPPLASAPTEIWPALERLEQSLDKYQQQFQDTPDRPATALLLLAHFTSEEVRRQHWQHWQWHADRAWLHDLAALPARLPGPTPAMQARYWQSWTPAGILCALALQEDPGLNRSAWHYLQVQRWQRVPVDGRDLQNWGIPAGPRLGDLLARLQDAAWNGAFEDKDGALRWLKQEKLLP
ncbi:CCA tRNA nucleotidyltransferase [Acidithiobacillus sp. AMEEHan]|uniref:CCA tRNA nucleotidyltransferase n=1 Tax=Acidithiobacillus sp. AMEEHan TaxID=2994951 RepID=UPI0027E3BD8E|nr:CCA tRNA nucleotidyltransferase [Acidithiobacillus sp. AMEEHan]